MKTNNIPFFVSAYLHNVASAFPKQSIIAKLIRRFAPIQINLAPAKSESTKNNYFSFKAAIKGPPLRLADELGKIEKRITPLLGKTIDPKIASLVLANGVSLDGTGRILEMPDSQSIPLNILDALESHLTKDLRLKPADRNSQLSGGTPERTLLLNFLQDMKKGSVHLSGADAQTVKDEQERLTKFWLSGEVNSRSTKNFFEESAKILKPVDIHLGERAEVMAQKAAKDKMLAIYEDAFHLRFFDTELVNHLLKSPTASMLQATETFSFHLLKEVDKAIEARRESIDLLPISDARKNEMLQQVIDNKIYAIAQVMKKDLRPWHTNTPDIREFIINPTLAQLKKILKAKPENGYDILKFMHISIKIFSAFPRPWKIAADENYSQVVCSVRSAQPDNDRMILRNKVPVPVSRVVSREFTSNAMGTMLYPYLTKSYLPEGVILRKNVTHTATQKTILSERDKNVYMNNGYSVHGASGSTNLISYFCHDIKKRDPSFNMSDVFAGCMMFLTLDGGHAISESVSVYRSLLEIDEGDDERYNKRINFLNKGTHDYTQLNQLFASSDTRSLIEGAINQAFAKTQSPWRDSVIAPERV